MGCEYCWDGEKWDEEHCMGSHGCREEWEKKQEEKKDTKSEEVKK